MALVLQIRGVNGSGKSTLVRSLLGCGKGESQAYLSAEQVPDLTSADNEVVWTRMIYKGTDVIALGRYDKPSGGCDATKTQDHIVNRLRYLVNIEPGAIILFEGVIPSTIFARYGVLGLELNQMGHHFAVGYMQTSRSQCLENIQTRRGVSTINRTAFDLEGFDRKNRAIERTRPKFNEVGLDTFDISYPDGLADLQRYMAVG